MQCCCFHGCQPGRLQVPPLLPKLLPLVSSETSSTVASGESAASGSYTGTPIKVGGIGPITGAAATYGNAVKNAEELAVKEINAANGSDVFDWKFEDDEHDAEKSVNAYNSLKDWGMRFWLAPLPLPRPWQLLLRASTITCSL